MSLRADAFGHDLLARWCQQHLGSPPTEVLFRSGHLSAVTGVRLVDGREVVVKVRPGSPRLAGCVEVQRRLFLAGYPCPQPLTDVVPFGEDVATAEAFVAGGAALPSGGQAARLFAAAFARLIELAPLPGEVSPLTPPPSWTAWNHDGAGLWPPPEDSDVDLDEATGAEWIDEVGNEARERLRAGAAEPVIGHGDWLASNLRWDGDDLVAVHDWDSLIVESEAVLVGFAAALYSTTQAKVLATVEDSERFLAAYGDARGRALSVDEVEQSWAAGAWTRAYDAKYQHAVGQPISSLSQSEARERIRRSRGGSG